MTTMKKNKMLSSFESDYLKTKIDTTKKKLDELCNIEEITPERFSQFWEVLAEFKNLLRNSHDN